MNRIYQSIIYTKIPETVTIRMYEPFNYLQVETKHIMYTGASSYK